MSTVKTELKRGQLFAKQVLARLVGDGNEEKANKIARKSLSAIDAQVAGLTAKEVDAENAVEEAEEALNSAIYPSEMISNNESYCRNIVMHQQYVDDAKATLNQIKESKEFFEGLLKTF